MAVDIQNGQSHQVLSHLYEQPPLNTDFNDATQHHSSSTQQHEYIDLIKLMMATQNQVDRQYQAIHNQNPQNLQKHNSQSMAHSVGEDRSSSGRVLLRRRLRSALHWSQLEQQIGAPRCPGCQREGVPGSRPSTCAAYKTRVQRTAKYKQAGYLIAGLPFILVVGSEVIVCLDCFLFFREIALEYIYKQSQKAAEHPILFRCLGGSGNCHVEPKNKNCCRLCWLDACLLAGLTGVDVVFDSERRDRIPKMRLKRAQHLDAMLAVRRNTLLERRASAIYSGNNVPALDEESLAEIGMIKSMTHIDEAWQTLRLASSGTIQSVYELLIGRSTEEFVTGKSPLLLGNLNNQKRVLFDSENSVYCSDNLNNCNHRGRKQRYCCLLPSSVTFDNLKEKDYVTVYLEPSHPYPLYIYFLYLDVFLAFELAHTMPVFALLDPLEMKKHLSFASSAVQFFTLMAYSASLGAGMVVYPGGTIPMNALMDVLARAERKHAKQQQILKESQKNSEGYKNRIDEENEATETVSPYMVPFKVSTSARLLKQAKKVAHKYSVEFVEHFKRLSLSPVETVLLRAMLITLPRASNVSSETKLLLETEWKKYAKMLRNHLQRTLGTQKAAEQRYTVILQLVEFVFEEGMRTSLQRKRTMPAIIKAPGDHFHCQHDGEEENNQENMNESKEHEGRRRRRTFPPFILDVIRATEEWEQKRLLQ